MQWFGKLLGSVFLEVFKMLELFGSDALVAPCISNPPQGYSSQTRTVPLSTELEFNNIPICDVPCSTIYVVFIGLFLGSVVDPMMAEIPGPSVGFLFCFFYPVLPCLHAQPWQRPDPEGPSIHC